MSLLNIGLCSVLTCEVLDRLKSKNIRKTTEYICKDPEDIAQLAGITYKDAVCIRDVILAKYSSISVNGCDFYNSVVESSAILSTGIRCTDEILDGGLYTGEVTELAGDSAAGKTQICLSGCATTAFQDNHTVAYIDTGAAFSAGRLLQMVDLESSNQDKFLARIQVYDAYTIHDIFAVIESIQLSIKERKDPFYSELRLIIIDNVASVVYPFLGGGSFAESQGLLCLLGQKLKQLASEYSLAVLTTNNLVKGEAGGKVASLGRLWSHVPHVRLIILGEELYQDTKRQVNLVKSSRGATGSCTVISFTENGPIT